MNQVPRRTGQGAIVEKSCHCGPGGAWLLSATNKIVIINSNGAIVLAYDQRHFAAVIGVSAISPDKRARRCAEHGAMG